MPERHQTQSIELGMIHGANWTSPDVQECILLSHTLPSDEENAYYYCYYYYRNIISSKKLTQNSLNFAQLLEANIQHLSCVHIVLLYEKLNHIPSCSSDA